MRLRKPWRRLRTNLLGWYVRFTSRSVRTLRKGTRLVREKERCVKVIARSLDGVNQAWPAGVLFALLVWAWLCVKA